MQHSLPATSSDKNPRWLKKRSVIAGAALGAVAMLGIGTAVALSDTPAASADVSQPEKPTMVSGGTFTFETDDGECEVRSSAADGNLHLDHFDLHDFDLGDFDIDLSDIDLGDFDADDGSFAIEVNAGGHTFALECSSEG